MTVLYVKGVADVYGLVACDFCSTDLHDAVHDDFCPVLFGSESEAVKFGRFLKLGLWDVSGELPC